MTFIHSRMHLTADSIISVHSTHESNILLLDDENYSAYRCRDQFIYHGGFYRNFPAKISIPYTGNWNIILALPSEHITKIRHSINIIPA
ncbi:DUF1883 domain-containing protein [Enterobacter ludwigii]|jgi:hypothetical protein|uniref:DUF1883 domain-containing protein n=1 Tax=Enterobacter ludwigii TaxID=299767 RepID=UPI0013D68089|nr:DUF1883 domain-containing protein [Enterobacter ludwigii]